MTKHVNAQARAARKRRPSEIRKLDKTAAANKKMKTTNRAVRKLEHDSYVAPEDLRIPFSF